ncbi:P-loop containing nucleoside triphosphate hydrolase protein [Aspergillus brunneoviolaceus CBS 621.78]|uniref:P-loop containing nucleoside triphosphate hydrolase protein n=2 Tax=Aspergillus TaxID=5052 RepID=A0A8G1W1S0_9EURO|nr:P-loop containing nucleoside triphosphate hydrolase protein [Aspergillus brunneoviolaceus CBS 621.78]XP_040801324.1 P-loop containing nucleoside triphosphate hydrolase protein [Aspergillus fijiensis CBS 313.89]RAH40814.1 P-loop containing nucleoside triphosphate hydrolase protein [Aspergillus brunneoviolaceus CBS 621.78]RAK77314.1 P-loop containing nucleoside triphosphate hydrolase protein [Aspergillus fijiensis CBS 313.89]
MAYADLPDHILSQEQCPEHPFPLLLPRVVQGYNLIEKVWIDLEVEHISDVRWNTQAFENLVTEEQTKDLLEALVRNQLSIETSTDLISGKGNGLIILLHGGPGTGKTYTAESVADYARKPLYRVTCGDIGTRPADVEKYLETVLRLGRIWGCVVLLDEADIFLEERTLADLERNALVSVFLRVLEYYNGILILTSNRVGHFDEAFRSRIQLALHYESLGPDQRHQIWSNFIKHLRASEACSMDFDDLVLHINDLSMYEMNGRQIRNAITTARQLAEFKNKRLNYEIIKKVITVTGRFDRYLQGVKQLESVKEGTVDDTLAREAGTR